VIAHLLGARTTGEKIDIKTRAIAQETLFSDHFYGLAVGHGHHIHVSLHSSGHHVTGRGLREGPELFVGQQRHRFLALGQICALLGILELATLGQNPPVTRRILNHLRSPDYASARIVSAEDGHDHA
jgi:hypothetical protein